MIVYCYSRAFLNFDDSATTYTKWYLSTLLVDTGRLIGITQNFIKSVSPIHYFLSNFPIFLRDYFKAKRVSR